MSKEQQGTQVDPANNADITPAVGTQEDQQPSQEESNGAGTPEEPKAPATDNPADKQEEKVEEPSGDDNPDNPEEDEDSENTVTKNMTIEKAVSVNKKLTAENKGLRARINAGDGKIRESARINLEIALELGIKNAAIFDYLGDGTKEQKLAEYEKMKSLFPGAEGTSSPVTTKKATPSNRKPVEAVAASAESTAPTKPATKSFEDRVNYWKNR